MSLLVAVLGLLPLGEQEGILVLRGARIVTLSGADHENGALWIEGGRIKKCGGTFEIPAGARVIDVPKGAWLLPGFIDAHSHLGSAFEIEESTEALTPQVKAVEAFSSRHPDVLAALGSGVTLLALAPGDGNVLGGRMGTLRLNGARYDRALHKDVVALKLSMGPEAFRRDREPTTRAGAAALLRVALREKDLRSLPLFIHVPGRAEIEGVLSLSRELGLHPVLLHPETSKGCLDLIGEARVPVALRALHPGDSRENYEAAGRLARRGVPVAFVSDAPRAPEAALRVSAALAVQYGMPREAALQALTTVPARLLGLESEFGKLEEGRGADLVVWSGDPLCLSSAVELVVIGGVITYQRGAKP